MTAPLEESKPPAGSLVLRFVNLRERCLFFPYPPYVIDSEERRSRVPPVRPFPTVGKA
jgi:hypothetical protein